MNENTKYSSSVVLDEEKSQLDDSFSSTMSSFSTDKIIPHQGLAIEVAVGEWIPSTQVLWRSWTGRRSVWGLEWHGPVFNVDRDDSVPYAGKRVCTCTICQEHVHPTAKPN